MDKETMIGAFLGFCWGVLFSLVGIGLYLHNSDFVLLIFPIVVLGMFTFFFIND